MGMVLFAVGQPQKELIGRDPFIQVDSLQMFKGIRKGQLLAFLDDKGKVKVISVKVDQTPVHF